MKRNFRYATVVKTVFLTIIVTAFSLARLTLGDDAVPYKSITPLVESTTERTAIVAFRHIAQARSDIHRKALASARREVAEAARLMGTIRDDLSSAPAKNLILIARKHLEHEQARQVLREFPPIYSVLEEISTYLPVDKAKMHIDKAKGFLERNVKRSADRELDLANKSLIVIEVELPLLKAQHYVAKAQRYLAAGNAVKADEALRVSEQRAMALYTGVKSPLFQAKRNIWLAFRNYSPARKTAAGPYLAVARENLGKSAAGGSAKAKEEAGKLSKEVAELQKKLAGEEKVPESALKAVWEKSEALAERAVAYLSAGLSETETTVEGENSLIEAGLHLAYAETYQVTTAEPDKASRELDTADSYLQKAARSSLIGPADRKKIGRIGSIIQALKASPEKNDSVIQERYDTAREGLNDLKVKEELLNLNQKIR